MKEDLFSDFDKQEVEKWRQVIEKDLKGKDFDNTLVWKSMDDIKVLPYYTSEEDSIQYTNKSNTSWDIIAPITISEKANQEALDNLNGGATQVHFINHNHSSFEIGSLIDKIDILLATVSFENIDWNNEHIDFWKKNKNAKVHLGINPLQNFDTKTIFKISWLKKLLEIKQSLQASWGVLLVDGSSFKNNGARISDEIAFILSTVQENFHQLRNVGFKTNEIGDIYIKTAIGPNFFFELAKLKTLRNLLHIIANQYEGANFKIIAETAQIYHSHLDRETNILRMTTEAISAILGSADGVMLQPFKEGENTFTQRISRNIQHLLIEESHFDKHFDPAKGNYYISHLIKDLKEKAWNTFLGIEKEGGLLVSVLPKKLNQKHKEILEENSFTGKLAMIGTNKFPNPKDDFISHPIQNTNTDKRISVPFENLKLRTLLELKKKPSAYLWRNSISAQSKAIANFAYNFLQIAAIDSEEGNSNGIWEDTLKEISDTQPDIVVLCFDKDSQSETVPKAIQTLQEKTIIIYAGRENFEGTHLNIYNGVNIVDSLNKVIDLLSRE
ncbi:MAG: methylmalonyl-CoA mutase family protein [Chitinophagales bacterium]|nr:methylmalonyl-CoA mutase family protein [Chitinophagales bacterium]